MTMKKEWIIDKLECKTSDNGLTNVVQKIFWMYRFTETINGEEYSSELNGQSELPNPNLGSFTQFENLTREQVEGWIVTTIDPEYLQVLEDALYKNISELVNPPIVTLPPPF